MIQIVRLLPALDERLYEPRHKDPSVIEEYIATAVAHRAALHKSNASAYPLITRVEIDVPTWHAMVRRLAARVELLGNEERVVVHTKSGPVDVVAVPS